MELISVVTSISGIIEKIVLVIKGRRDNRDAKSKLLIDETRRLLQDVSSLIEKFNESVDVILEAIETAPIEGIDPKSHFWLKANRRLFELATDMRILTNSIDKRLPGADTKAIHQISDGCMQIAKAEFYILGVIPNSVINRLPEVSDDLRFQSTDNTIFVLTLLDERGRPTDFAGRNLRKNAVDELNSVLVHIIECKEKLSVALNSIS